MANKVFDFSSSADDGQKKTTAVQEEICTYTTFRQDSETADASLIE